MIIYPEDSDRRKLTKLDLSAIAMSLKKVANKLHYEGDLSDLGNEIGVVIGKHYDNLNKEEIGDLISGLKHGISLTNGTH